MPVRIHPAMDLGVNFSCRKINENISVNITLNLSGATIDKADEPCGVRRFHVTHGESKE